MRIIRTIKQMQQWALAAKRKGKTIGFVPTMGYFHEGHLSLLRKSKKENDVTVVSIFVNPIQFGPKEDLTKYPRDFKRDELFAKKENVDIIFYPSAVEMYPNRYLTYVDVQKMSEGLCGEFRPGHFRGVATIVAKFLNIVTPRTMYLGQKDAQQAAILKKMVKDLNFLLQVKVLPTVREQSGLALSSRNSYLTREQLAQAAILYRTLRWAKKNILSGERRAQRLTGQIKNMIEKNSSLKVEYVACVNAEELTALKTLRGNILIALAAYLGQTRLIDNITVRIR